MKFSKAALVVSFALVVINGVYLFIDPVPQWPSYHCFADDRSWLGLSNAQNVLSNLGLFIVGRLGLPVRCQPAGAGGCGASVAAIYGVLPRRVPDRLRFRLVPLCAR